MLNRYKPFLQSGGSGKVVKDLPKIIQFSMKWPEEMKRFRSQIQTRISTINLILQAAQKFVLVSILQKPICSAAGKYGYTAQK
jgi:hypothetical protein